MVYDSLNGKMGNELHALMLKTIQINKWKAIILYVSENIKTKLNQMM